MTPDEWFVRLEAALAGLGQLTAVTEAERVALLDLARIAAHSSERWTAPVSTYLVGLALAGVDPQARAEAIVRLVADLDGA
jgi:hypothetical protein